MQNFPHIVFAKEFVDKFYQKKWHICWRIFRGCLGCCGCIRCPDSHRHCFHSHGFLNSGRSVGWVSSDGHSSNSIRWCDHKQWHHHWSRRPQLLSCYWSRWCCYRSGWWIERSLVPHYRYWVYCLRLAKGIEGLTWWPVWICSVLDCTSVLRWCSHRFPNILMYLSADRGWKWFRQVAVW